MFAALAAAAGNLVGGILQNNAAKDIANDNNMVTERLANSEYQRGMADMQAAGLNPILAAKVGGASTPNLQAAPVQNVVGPAVSTALQTYRMGAELDQIQAQTYATKAQGVLADTQAAKTATETAILNSQSSARSQAARADEARDSMREKAWKGGEMSIQKVVDSIMSKKEGAVTNPSLLNLLTNGSRSELKAYYDRMPGFSVNSAKSLDSWPQGVLKPPRQ